MKIKELCEQAVIHAKNAFARMPYKHVIAGFVVTTFAVAFCVRMYFKQPDMSILTGELIMTEQDRQAMLHHLEARLTLTETRISDAQNKLQCTETRINNLESRAAARGSRSSRSKRLAFASKSMKQKIAAVDEHIRNEVARELARMDEDDKGP